MDFSEENVQAAITAIQEGMSRREAEMEFGVPKTTLGRRLKGPSNKPGRPPVLTAEEETIIVDRIQIMCQWGFPLDGSDLRQLVKNYLDRKGVKVERFQDNLPGHEFVIHFKKRHPELTERFAGNIKRSRAKINPDTVNEFFDNLETELEGIPPDCIFNYDETNLSDDPGRKKCLMKRGTKYPERILNSSKSCTSLMFCGSATGQILPVYVVYKALNVYQGWIERGPPNARYSCSKSGWFDNDTFEDWFIKVFLPVAKTKETTALIGDNLSSHFSKDVLQLCRKYNVKFICLPPNSTDKTQPLDVAFFRPLKIKWRKILNAWKTSHPKESSVPKTVFPKLLKELTGELNKENLISGFKKCGIYPLDRHQVLKRLPNEDNQREANLQIDESLIDILKSASGKNDAAPKRGKKHSFAPGKDISVSAENKDTQSKSEEQESESEMDTESEDESEMDTESEDVLQDTDDKENQNPKQSSKVPVKGSLKVSDWVVVKYNIACSSKSNSSIQHFVGQIVEVVSDAVFMITFVRPQYSQRCTQYKWPSRDDVDCCDFIDIVEVLPHPKMTRRGGVTF